MRFPPAVVAVSQAFPLTRPPRYVITDVVLRSEPVWIESTRDFEDRYPAAYQAFFKGAPTGHTLTVREARASVGAGFVYPIAGDMRTMPGLGTRPAASIIDFDEHGEIVGLS